MGDIVEDYKNDYELRNRGPIGEAGATIGGGVVGGVEGLARQAHQVGKITGWKGLEETGEKATSYIKRLQETTPGLQPNPSLGPVARTVTGIVRALSPGA